MLDDKTRFQAMDEAVLLSLIAETEVVRRKAKLYQQLATNPQVKDFFEDKAAAVAKAEKKLRKMLAVLPED